MDENSKTFIVYVTALEALEPHIHLSQALLLAALQKDKALTKIPPEYADYVNVFSPDLAIELPKSTGMNKYVIKLEKEK